MTLPTIPSDGTWTSDIGPTSADTPIQCRGGILSVSWADPAPASTLDGFVLGDREAIVVPSGTTFRLAALNSTAPTAFYEEF